MSTSPTSAAAAVLSAATAAANITIGRSGYVDDCFARVSSNDTATVKASLESISSAIPSYMNQHLVLNNDKT